MSEPDAAISWLGAFLNAHGAIAGTVHQRRGDLLHLVAQVHIPPPVVAVVGTIPRGKGMAGLAWSRQAPVQTCDLQTDATGDVRPGARAVQAGAAVALPVIVDGQVAAVVGAAFPGTGDLPDAQVQTLMQTAAAVLDVL